MSEEIPDTQAAFVKEAVLLATDAACEYLLKHDKRRSVDIDVLMAELKIQMQMSLVEASWELTLSMKFLESQQRTFKLAASRSVRRVNGNLIRVPFGEPNMEHRTMPRPSEIIMKHMRRAGVEAARRCSA